MDFPEQGYRHCFTDFTNRGWLCLGCKLYSCVLSQKFKDVLFVGSVLSVISQKITAVFFFFPGCNMVRGLWTSFGKSFIIINLPTPKEMIIYYKASFSKDWTQSAYLLSVASNLCVIHFSLTSALPRLIHLQCNSLSVFLLIWKNVHCYSTPRNKVTIGIRLLFSLDHTVMLYASLFVKTSLLKTALLHCFLS